MLRVLLDNFSKEEAKPVLLPDVALIENYTIILLYNKGKNDYVIF